LQPVQHCLRYTGQGRIHTANYSLLPVDLRDLGALQASLESAGFQPTIPTYVLAECVLVYMEPHESAALLKHLGQQLPSAVCVVYEQVLPYCHLCFAHAACHAIYLTCFMLASAVYWHSWGMQCSIELWRRVHSKRSFDVHQGMLCMC